MANVSQLQPILTPQVQTASSEAPEKDADVCFMEQLLWSPLIPILVPRASPSQQTRSSKIITRTA